MIDEDRLRARLKQAIGYEPPSPSFGTARPSSLIVRRVAWRNASERRNSIALAFVAALISLAIVVTLMFGARALHPNRSVPVHPGPYAPLVIKASSQPCGGSGSAGPVEVFSSGAGWASGPGYLADVAGQTLAKGPYRTTDGGVHWIKVAPPAIGNLSPDGETEFFLDSNHAWVAEAAGSGNAVADHVVVFSTADAGKTWLQSAALRITPADRTDVIWKGSGYSHWMCFIDAKNGWLLIESGPASPMAPLWRTGALFRTADGGLSWTLVSNNPGSTVVRSLGGGCAGGYGIGDGVVFSTSLTGWLPLDGCASPNAVLVTRDGGVTWSAQYVPINYPTAPYFIDSEHGVMVGQDYVIATTTDGGLSWVAQPALPDECSDVTFVAPAEGWCIGHAASAPGAGWFVFQTKDGGHTWVTQSGVTMLGSLTFVDTKIGYQIVGEYPGSADWVLFKTVDAGLTWTRIG